jgi:iron complex outermembrane recepter protein
LKNYLKISTAAFAIASLGAGLCVGAAPAFAQEAPAKADENDRGIAEIVVTATRREESLNKIPLAIQALSGDSLADLNVTNFEKLVEFLPNVRTASRGPGASSIYIRGLSTDTAGSQIQGTAGASPSVALYVNDAPASLVGRNLDFYAADLQRVEVLAGPQGTLFGASAMGGAVRYITNKPDLTEFHAGFNGSYSFTKSGDNSTAGDGFINVPIIEDRLAVRVVLYNDNQGGYIDNVAGTYQMPFNGNVGVAGRLPTGNPLLVRNAIRSCAGVVNCTGSNFRAPIRQSINNDRFVEDNYNDASYAGGRIAATFKVNDDWSIDLMHARQELKSDGVFDYEPGVGDLKVTQFNENTLRDKYDLTTLTINGRLGFLDLIYTGSFLNHNALQKSDYAGYSNIGLYVPYYECDAGVYYANPARGNTCYTPNKSYQVRNRTKRKTHEFRVTTPGENRIRGTAGIFYDDNQLVDNTDWSYLQSAAGFIYPRSPNPIVAPNDPSVRPVAVGFFNDVKRKDRQFAIYGEASFDIIPDALTITGGLRYYNEKAGINGSSATSFDGVSRGIYNPATGTYTASATPPRFYGVSANLNQLYADISPATYKGLLKKGNITYKFNEGSLIYATYSEGFRPGGFNRRPCRVGTATCPTQADFNRLGVYVPDEVKNYEIGGKFSLLDRTLQLNFAAYRIDWSDIQQTLFDQNISNQTFTTNLTDARIQGVEGDLTWRTTPELTFNAAFSYNDSKITRYTKPTTVINPIGSPLALSPKFQGNIRVRYETELSSGLKPFAQAAVHHVGKSISSTINNVDIRYSGPAVRYNGVAVNPGDVISPLPASLPQKSYNTFSYSVGVSKDQWGLEFFAENITDERPELFKSANDGELRVTTSRPATIGLRASFKM